MTDEAGKNILGPTIKKVRVSKKMTQKELGKLTGFSQNTVSQHENGDRALGETAIQKYATALNTTPQALFDMYVREESIKQNRFIVDPYQTRLDNLIDSYNDLSNERKKLVDEFVDQQRKDQNNKVVALPTQDEAVQLQANGVLSAGVGEFLDDSTETFPVTVREPIPKCYDYIFKVNGQSMEPTFEDGQVIFVTKHEEYRSGQIVAAIVDGCAYVKRLRYNDDEMTLVSLNPDYPNVQVLDDDNYEILGVAFA